MIAYAMLYAAAVALPILVAAIVCSATLRRYGMPERGVWLVALGLALTLPVAFLMNPLGATSVGEAGTVLMELPAGASAMLFETGVFGLPAMVTVPVEPSGLGLDEALLLVWLLATALLALRWAVAARRLARADTSWRSSTVDGVRVRLTPDVGPAVSGVFRTRILVPSWLISLPEEQRSLVLLHEEEHVRARDPVLLAVSRIVRILFPWNPVLWLMSSRLLHAVELDCDRRVLSRRPDIATYGDTLLTVSARDSNPLVAAAAFAESQVPLRKRIVAMTTPPRTVSVLGASTAVALGIVLVMGSCEVPIPRLLEPAARTDVVDAPQANVLSIWVGRDGSVLLNGEPHPMEDVSEIVAPLYAASKPALVVSILGDREAPYAFIDQLQKELMAAGVRRVVLPHPFSPGRRPPSQEQPGADEGLRMLVLPSGVVDVRRGASTRVEQFRNLIAAVKTDPDVPYRYMAAVLEALKSAFAERISLQVLENERCRTLKSLAPGHPYVVSGRAAEELLAEGCSPR